MSPKRDKTVPQLVEKYRREYPSLERPLLRKLMRLENPHLFKKNPSNLKKLDRHLKKTFENMESSSKDPSVLQSVKNGFGFFKWLDRRGERKQLERIEGELKFLRAQRIYWRARVDTEEYVPKTYRNILDCINEEIKMLEKMLKKILAKGSSV